MAEVSRIGLVFTGQSADAVEATAAVDKAVNALTISTKACTTSLVAQAAAATRLATAQVPLGEGMTTSAAAAKAQAAAMEASAAATNAAGAAALKAGKEMSAAGLLAERAAPHFHGFAARIIETTVAFAGAYGLYEAVRSVREEFKRNAETAVQTEAVIKSTGAVAGVTAEHVRRLAESIQLNTRYDDEAVRAAENMLLTFTKVRNVQGANNDIFDQATKAIIDLNAAMSAAGKNTSLAQNAIMVGKALQDPVRGMTALRRVGVNFDAQAVETVKKLVSQNKMLEAQRFILAELNREFEGSAQVQGTTFGGTLTRVTHLTLDLSRTMLQGLTPSLQKVADWLDQEIKHLTTDEDAKRRLIDRTKALTDAIVNFVTWVGKSANAAAQFVGGWKNALTLLIGAWAGFKAAGIAAAVAVQVANVMAAGITESAWKAALIATGWGVFAVAAGAAAAYVITHWEQVKQWFEAFWEGMKTLVKDWQDVVKIYANLVAYQLLLPFEAFLRALEKATGWIPGVGGKIKAALNVVVSGIESFRERAQKEGQSLGDAFVSGWNQAMNKFKYPDLTKPSSMMGSGSGNTARNAYWALLAQQTGFPLTMNSLNFLNQWAQREGINQNIDPFNLLGTTQQVGGSRATNKAGVQAYKTMEDGVKALSMELRQSNFKHILWAIASGDPVGYIATHPEARKEFLEWSGGAYTSPVSGRGQDIAAGSQRTVVGVLFPKGMFTKERQRPGGATAGLRALAGQLAGAPSPAMGPSQSHVPKSYHWAGEALDITGSPEQLIDDWNFLYPLRFNLAELIWHPTPDVAAVCPGAPGGYFWGVKGGYSDHTDHIHVAFTGTVKELQRIVAAAQVSGPGVGLGAPPTAGAAKPKPKKIDVSELSGPTQELLASAAADVSRAKEGSMAWIRAERAQIEAWEVAMDELQKRLDSGKRLTHKQRADIINAITSLRGNITGARKAIVEAQKALIEQKLEMPTAEQIDLANAKLLTGKTGIRAQMQIWGEEIARIKALIPGLSGKPLLEAKQKLADDMDALKSLTTELFPPIEMAAPGTRRSLMNQLTFIVNHLQQLTPALAKQVSDAAAKLRERITKAARDGFTAKEADTFTDLVAKLFDKDKLAQQLSGSVRVVEAQVAQMATVLSHFPAEVRRKLGPQLELARQMVKGILTEDDLTHVKDVIDGVMDELQKAVDAANAAMQRAHEKVSAAFQRLIGMSYQVFDAQTQKLLDNVSATVTSLTGAFAPFIAKLNELTPTEKALQERERQKAIDDAAKRVDDLRSQIAELQQPVNLEREKGESLEAYRRRVADQTEERNKQLADLNQQLQEELFQQETDRLQDTATAEREAADKALTAEQDRIEKTRAVEKEQMQWQIDQTIAMWDANEITTEEAQQKILEILNSHGVDYQAAGELLGGAFQSAWEKAFLQIFPLIDDYNKKMREALDLQAQLARVAPDVVDKMATTIEEASKLGAVFPGGTFHFAPPQLPGFTQPISTFHFQHGGVVPGRFIAHQDTVLSALQPGERVLTREQNIVFGQLAEALRTGKLGQPTFVFHGHVWDKEQLMRDVRDDLARYGTVTPGGIFGGRG